MRPISSDSVKILLIDLKISRFLRAESSIFINELVFRSKLAMRGKLHIGAKWYLTLANSDVPQVDSSHRKCCHYVISIRQKGVGTDSEHALISAALAALHAPRGICIIFPSPYYIFNNPRYGTKMNLIR